MHHPCEIFSTLVCGVKEREEEVEFATLGLLREKFVVDGWIAMSPYQPLRNPKGGEGSGYLNLVIFC